MFFKGTFQKIPLQAAKDQLLLIEILLKRKVSL